MRTLWIAAAVLIAAACSGRQAGEEPASPTAVPTRHAGFTPPGDGTLTGRQVELFLAVARSLEQRRLRTPEAVRTPGTRIADALEGVAPDVGAARAVFATTEEYLWVKERILEAEAADMAARLNAAEEALLRSTLADLRARLAEAADEGSRKLLSEQIVTFEGEAARTAREGREKEPESVRANLKVLEPYRSRLSALEDEVVRAGLALGREPAPPRREPATQGPAPPATP